jgi:hypothetical protein
MTKKKEKSKRSLASNLQARISMAPNASSIRRRKFYTLMQLRGLCTIMVRLHGFLPVGISPVRYLDSIAAIFGKVGLT